MTENTPLKKYIMITAEEIKSFLEGNDPEEHIDVKVWYCD